jgi:hypothetical protein
MKLNKTNRHQRINAFWSWFQNVAGALSADVENRAILAELDGRVHGVHPGLSWEIGPGLSKPWQLVISPNLNRELRETAREVVSQAPVLPSWEFHSARQAKESNYRLDFRSDNGAEVRLDVSAWTFVFLRHPDGFHEILLKGNEPNALGPDERWQAAALTLESVLGEDMVLDRINSFELVDQFEPQFVDKARPIQRLREAVAGV